MWFSEPKTQTRPSSPDAGPVRPAACAPRAAPPCTHTDTHGISATQPTVWGVRTDAASAATAPLDLGHKLRAYALEMGIPRGQCPLGHHGTTHWAQAHGKAEAITALVSAATDSTAAIGSAAALTPTDNLVLTGGSRTEERRGDTAGRSCRGEGGGMSGAPATER